MGTPSLLVRLAWRNLWRHRRRTALILLALALGVWSMIVLAALSRGSLEQQITKGIGNLIGHAQVHAPGYRDDPVIDHRFAVPSSLAQAMRDPSIRAWSTRVRVPSIIASERESAGVILVGIDPAAERALSFIPGAVVEGRGLADAGDDGLLLGRKLAERLETGLGRRVVILSQDVHNRIAERGYRVVGIFAGEPTAMETGYVFVGRQPAQRLLKMQDSVSELAVITPDRRRLGALVEAMRRAAPGLDVEPWTAVEPLLVLTENLTEVILVIWYAIVFAAMSFGLVNTLLMAVYERTREFGLVQSLGMRPGRIMGQVFIESLFLLLLALVLGNLLTGVTLFALRDGLDLSAFAEGFDMIGVSPIIVPSLTAGDVLTANGLVLALGLFASLWPVWRAARHVPVEAMTRI
jgi:ABC-type lipoprotein release transport system permease subunit